VLIFLGLAMLLPQTPAMGLSWLKPKPKPKTAAEAHADAHARSLAEAQACADRDIYSKTTTDMLGAKWKVCLKNRREWVPAGRLSVSYHIRPDGKVENVRMVNDKEASQSLKNITLQTFKEVRFPRMPPQVPGVLAARPGVPAGRMEKTFTFIVTAAENWEVMELDGKSPLSRYARGVGGLAGQAWARHLRAHPLPPAVGGTVRLDLLILPDGRLRRVHVFAPGPPKEAVITALATLKLPPVPKEVAAYLAARPAGYRYVQLPFVLTAQVAAAHPPPPSRGRKK